MITTSYSDAPGHDSVQKALLFYGPNADRTTHITKHKISIINDKPVMMEGETITAESMKAFANSVMNIKTKALTVIQEHVIAMDDDVLVWWVPAHKTRMFFKTHVVGLENVSAEVQQPPLLFVVRQLSWYVFALPANERPTADTELLFSPYFNVWDNHCICEGSTKRPKTNNVNEWTKAFFSSAFTHTNYKSKESKLLKGKRETIWRRLFAGKCKKFPLNVLPPAGITVGQMLKEISE